MFEGEEEDRELLAAVFSFVASPDYLTRQAACRAIPAVLPASSIRLHLTLLPSLLAEETETNRRCGLIELAEVYVRFLGSGEEQACLEACERLAQLLPSERHSLVGGGDGRDA